MVKITGVSNQDSGGRNWTIVDDVVGLASERFIEAFLPHRQGEVPHVSIKKREKPTSSARVSEAEMYFTPVGDSGFHVLSGIKKGNIQIDTINGIVKIVSMSPGGFDEIRDERFIIRPELEEAFFKATPAELPDEGVFNIFTFLKRKRISEERDRIYKQTVEFTNTVTSLIYMTEESVREGQLSRTALA